MPIRIVIVVPAFPQTSETFIAAKVAALLDRGHDVTVICSRSEKAQWQNFPQLAARPGLRGRVRTQWLQRPRWLAGLLCPFAMMWAAMVQPRLTARYLGLGWKRFGAGIFRQLYLDLAVLLARPQVIHFEFGTLARGRMHLREFLGASVVVSFRGYDINYAGLDDPQHYDEVWSKADAIHTLGEDLLARARKRGCPPAARISLISPALGVSLFEQKKYDSGPLGTPNRPLRILSVGRLEWKKGYDYAILAIQELKRRGLSIEYRIIGDGSYREAVLFAMHDLGVADRVKLLGARPHHEVPSQMKWADVYLHTAVSEGFCNAVLEAQAAGLPVVTSDADGLAENVEDGVTGFVTPRRSAPAAAAALYRMANEPQTRSRMGAAGRKRVEKRFRLVDQMDKFEQLYEDLVAAESSSPKVTVPDYSRAASEGR